MQHHRLHAGQLYLWQRLSGAVAARESERCYARLAAARICRRAAFVLPPDGPLGARGPAAPLSATRQPAKRLYVRHAADERSLEFFRGRIERLLLAREPAAH